MINYSIIQKSQLESAHRIDAEHYQPEYLNAVKTINSYKHKKLGETIDILTDYHANGSYELLRCNVNLSREPDFALMVRAVDFENDNFDTDVRYVSKGAYEFLKKTKIFGREIIIDKIGKAGTVYLMPTLNRPVTLGMNLFMLRLKEDIDPEFVYVFLNSKFGKLLISQKITGTVPTSIDKASVRSIMIPIISKSLSNGICGIVKEAFDFKEKAHQYYSQAENLLLQELGLKDFKAQEDLSCIVNLSDVQSVHRIDAEYFQPKYERLIENIRRYNLKSLGDLASMKKGFEPGSNEYQDNGKLFLRVSSISKNGLIDKDQKYISDELYNELKTSFEPKKGEILLTKDATPGIAYVLKESIEGIIASGIMRLKPKENIDAEYIALCINSIIGQMQIERDAGGSIIVHWKPEQIKNLQILILPKSTQQKIADLVRKSHEARKKAQELLEEAKQKVEKMILTE